MPTKGSTKEGRDPQKRGPTTDGRGPQKRDQRKTGLSEISLCGKNSFGENGSLFKVNDGRGRLFKYSGCFPRGSKKEKSSHDDEYGHGQEKRRPSTYAE